MTKPYRRLELAGADVKIYSESKNACEAAAERIASSIRLSEEIRGKAVLGLATGATPEPVYAKLVEDYRSGSCSFANVSTFNLDEYYPMGPLDPNSYRSYMNRHLFGHVNLAANRAHVLDGTVPAKFADEQAAWFDEWITSSGGLDVQLLGLGRNGHIGFNEPSDLPVEEAIALRTRLVDLHPTTIADAIKDFGSEELVPRQALTMGIAPILAARSIIVLAFGERKAQAVVQSLKGPITAKVPGSLLQIVPGKVTWMIDRAAAAEIL